MNTNKEQPKGILIVEDSTIVQLELKKKLEVMGYDILATATSGEEAILKALKTKPDLVLMDIILQGKLNGIEAASEIRKKLDIPVIYTTALNDDETIEQAKITGPYGYLIKPYDEKELFVSIEIALKRHEFEKKLEESEAKYRSLFEESKDAINIRDKDEKFIDINKSMIELFGYDKDEITEMSIIDLFVNIEDMERFEGEMDEHGYVRDFEVKLRKKDGTELFGVATSNILRANNGRIKGYQGIIRDITDKKLLEDEKNRSIDNLRKAMNGIIQAMALTVEVRDPYTAGHQKRVANLARAIGDDMCLPRDQIEGIRMAGIIHDLGKMHVPAEILSRPGRISDIEFNIIKTHPKVGFDILKNIEFPWPIAQIVHQHHERIDGSGYPEGLKGEEILIEARVMGVADVVEAMVSHRPYRAALGIETALDEITKNSGIKYDANVVYSCNRIFKENDFGIEKNFEEEKTADSEYSSL